MTNIQQTPGDDELDKTRVLPSSATGSSEPATGTVDNDVEKTRLASSAHGVSLAQRPVVASALGEDADSTRLSVETDPSVSSPVESMPSVKRLQIGDVLKDRFVLEEVLGEGGMGVVFKALDLRKKEANDKEPYVALKVLNQDFQENPISLIALQRETKRAQTLSHPNIINVYDFDRDNKHVFMSMEYLKGQPLNRLIRELPEGGMPFKKAWPIIQGMAEALAYAHKKNIVHSDFKPGNVFIDESGEVKVLDFGIACAAGRADKKGADATVFNARDLGALTPAYASYEMLKDEAPDPRDDIYALACVTYELLAGKHPYAKISADVAVELKLQPKPVPGLNSKQWRGLKRALALKREDRTPAAEEFIADLQRRSPMFYGTWAAAAVVLIASGSNVYLSFHKVNEPPKVTTKLTAEQYAKVGDLLELADIHFEVGYLTAPTGSNALWAYHEVLKIDPYNEKAINGMQKIANALEQEAWKFYEQDNRAESLKKVFEGLEAVPNHEGLLKLKAKLER
ncbi:serine/threonine-protein kinase [Methylocaldum sp.]|uniref:serine/threonine-protein kinase n=1 Tax=Methylocaldum sp. TaxID=1969727 RepID=UPI002D4ABD63|nr:serine/threonine-protein kinase [Methylocaldum sp.]HYE35352.1 serine/threonine-protein kinase [Methylocaldum sp.]